MKKMGDVYELEVINELHSTIGTMISISVKSTKICIQKALSVLHKSIYPLSKSPLFSFPISTWSLFVNKVAIALGVSENKKFEHERKSFGFLHLCHFRRSNKQIWPNTMKSTYTSIGTYIMNQIQFHGLLCAWVLLFIWVRKQKIIKWT